MRKFQCSQTSKSNSASPIWVQMNITPCLDQSEATLESQPNGLATKVLELQIQQLQILKICKLPPKKKNKPATETSPHDKQPSPPLSSPPPTPDGALDVSFLFTSPPPISASEIDPEVVQNDQNSPLTTNPTPNPSTSHANDDQNDEPPKSNDDSGKIKKRKNQIGKGKWVSLSLPGCVWFDLIETKNKKQK